MFLETSLGCIHEVVQFSPALGVVSHIIMSIIHRFSSVKPCKCRDEVSEQKYFTLYQFLEKRFHTLGFHTQTQNLETSCTAE